jgi:hypothetical protein
MNLSLKDCRILFLITGMLAVGTANPTTAATKSDFGGIGERGWARTQHGWQPLYDFCADKQSVRYVVDDSTVPATDRPAVEYRGTKYIKFQRTSPDRSTILPFSEETNCSAKRGCDARFSDGKTSVVLPTRAAGSIGETALHIDCKPLYDATPNLSPQYLGKFICATPKRLIYVYKDNQWFYVTVDHKNANPSAPSLMLANGVPDALFTGVMHLKYENNGYEYQVAFGTNGGNAGASVKILRRGKSISEEECIFYTFDLGLIPE